MKFDKNFKEAIIRLPQAEKDKLLLRLLKKDLDLCNRLAFELLDTRTTDELQQEMEEELKNNIKKYATNFYSPGYFMMDLRHFSGLITKHVKITKDKMGDPYLNLILLTEALTYSNKRLSNTTAGASRKLCIYIVSKAFKILIGINKLDEDYFIEFRDNLIKLGKLFSENKHLMRTAIQNGFDIGWLLNSEIPEDIENIHKEIRKQGFLTSKVYLNDTGYNSDK